MEQVNSLLQKELAEIITRELPLGNGLVTVTYVECAQDLRNANVGISVIPENHAKRILRSVKANAGLFTSLMKKKVKIKTIPKFHWVIDENAKAADEIERILEQIRQEKK